MNRPPQPASAPAPAEFAVPPEHPSLPGHFPGDPIVPGVLLLELSVAALRERLPQLGPLLELRSAKFLKPVRPGDRVTVAFEATATAGRWRFSCSLAAGVAVRGELAFAAVRGAT